MRLGSNIWKKMLKNLSLTRKNTQILWRDQWHLNCHFQHIVEGSHITTASCGDGGELCILTVTHRAPATTNLSSWSHEEANVLPTAHTPHHPLTPSMETNLLRLVVGPFTDIKTGYRGFEMKRNHVFRMLVTVQWKFVTSIHEPQLALGNGFREILLSTWTWLCSI